MPMLNHVSCLLDLKPRYIITLTKVTNAHDVSHMVKATCEVTCHRDEDKNEGID